MDPDLAVASLSAPLRNGNKPRSLCESQCPLTEPSRLSPPAGVPSDNLNNTLLLWMLIRITSGNDSTDNRISSLHKNEWHYVCSALALAHLFIVQCRPRLHKHVNINFKVAMSLMFGMLHSLHWTFTFAPTSDSQ